MRQKKHIDFTLISILSITTLIGCNNSVINSSQSSKDFSDYVENKYCKTSVKDISDEYKYFAVGNVKSIQPVTKKADGTISTDGVEEVNPFDTNLIFSQYAVKDLNCGKDVMNIEDIIGPYTYKTHCLFDRHNYYLDENSKELINNLKVINDNYGGDFIQIDKELYNVLDSAIEMTVLSDGKFNVFVGELSDYWNKYINSQAAILDPTQTIDPAQTEEGIYEISNLLKNTPQAKDAKSVLELKKESVNGSEIYKVKFNRFTCSDGSIADKVSLTLGGIGKGYLTENLYQLFKNAQLTNGTIYAGSSSIIIMDKHAYNSNWNIQISNPFSIYSNPVGYVRLNEKYSISTSGSQINQYVTIVDGQYVTRQHIIDATTGYPSDNFDMVTIFSKKISSTIMDTLSTILINCSENEIEKYVAKIRETYDSDLEVVLCKKSEYGAKEFKIDVYLTKALLENEMFSKSDNPTTGSSMFDANLYYHTMSI